jgi:hypothetical protein
MANLSLLLIHIRLTSILSREEANAPQLPGVIWLMHTMSLTQLQEA